MLSRISSNIIQINTHDLRQLADGIHPVLSMNNVPLAGVVIRAVKRLFVFSGIRCDVHTANLHHPPGVPSVLRTRPPVGEESEEIGHADSTIAVKVRRSAGISAPSSKQCQQIGYADQSVRVKIPRTFGDDESG